MKVFLLLIIGVVGWSSSVTAGDTPYARPELLLEPTELAKPDVSRQFVILDVRSQAEYDLGHVPGARRVDHDAWKEGVWRGQGCGALEQIDWRTGDRSGLQGRGL